MTIIKNGCICGADYYTATEQCDDVDCKSERKDLENQKITIPFSDNDLDDLRNGNTFDWTFDGIDVHLRLETEEDLE